MIEQLWIFYMQINIPPFTKDLQNICGCVFVCVSWNKHYIIVYLICHEKRKEIITCDLQFHIPTLDVNLGISQKPDFMELNIGLTLDMFHGGHTQCSVPLRQPEREAEYIVEYNALCFRRGPWTQVNISEQAISEIMVVSEKTKQEEYIIQ